MNMEILADIGKFGLISSIFLGLILGTHIEDARSEKYLTASLVWFISSIGMILLAHHYR